MIWIYDCEIYKNFFSVIFKNPKSQEVKKFVIWQNINDLDELYNFINDRKKWLIGYNSFNFDNQILNYIHHKHGEFTFSDTDYVTRSIHRLVELIMDNTISSYKYNLPFKYIDLMKMNGLFKSLKLVGVSLKWKLVQDIPIAPDKMIKSEDVENILSYNLNDVLITEKLYEKSIDKLKLRKEICEKYDINVISESKSGIANQLLKKFYSEETGLKYKHFKDLRTNRKFIKFDWVVFKDIDFYSKVLIELLEAIKNFTYYESQPFFSRTFIFDRVKYKLGVGGIHSVDKGAIFRETEDEYIIDADISSMYPTTIINNNLKPEHLDSKFLNRYKKIRDDRLEMKSSGNKVGSDTLKIALNSVFGKTFYKHHWLHDPLVGFKITINGQLYVLMLIEKLVLAGFKIISANTDGIITIVKKDRLNQYKKILKEWEKEHNYKLDCTYYSQYIRKDVNNYIALEKNNPDKPKMKGIFNKEIDITKGYDKPIVSIALHEYFINNIPIQDTIKSNRDIHNFCIAKKIDNKFTNEYHTIKNGKKYVEYLQPSIRYYVSNKGGSLLKTNWDNSIIINYESTKNVTIFNEYKEVDDFKKYDIDYSYYINATRKILDEIINRQLSIFQNDTKQYMPQRGEQKDKRK